MTQQEETLARILDHVADIWLACKGIGAELEAWSIRPITGHITMGEHRVMTTTDPTIDIPSTEDVPAKVTWLDRFNTEIAHDQTTTTWHAEDETGGMSNAVSITPDADDSDETAIVHFLAGEGQFKVVATTEGGDGPIRAESSLYTITPGAPAVGVITLGTPAPTPH